MNSINKKTKTIISRASGWFAGEVIVIFMFILLLNNFLGNTERTIKADGVCYYDYLPSIFLYKDFGKTEKVQDDNKESKKERVDFLINYKGHYLNKFPAGTALLISPFYFYADMTAEMRGYDRDGYSLPYQKSVFYAGVFYLFWALFFLRKLLALDDHGEFQIFIIQIIFVFSTSLAWYASHDSAHSHVYSFFSITAFLFFARSYFKELKFSSLIWACVFLGLIIIIRNVNIIIVFFLPFLAGSWQGFRRGLSHLTSNTRWLITGLLLLFGIVFIQLYAWYVQTGEFFIYSYQGETFNFLSPAFADILFSYRKGLFVYAPALLLSSAGLYYWIKSQNYYLVLSWVGFFVLLTYILSSWWYWSFGCSYGLRAYIDFFAIFSFPLALLIRQSSLIIKFLLIPVFSFLIYLNIVQIWQYKTFILHWDLMDKQKYWEVFLRQDKKYEGLVWKKIYDFNNHPPRIFKTEVITEFSAPSDTFETIYSRHSAEIAKFDSVNLIQVKLDNEFSRNEDALVELSVTKERDQKVIYYHLIPFIHLRTTRLGSYQRGEYNFEFPRITEQEDMIVNFKITTRKTSVILKNIEINYIYSTMSK